MITYVFPNGNRVVFQDGASFVGMLEAHGGDKWEEYGRWLDRSRRSMEGGIEEGDGVVGAEGGAHVGGSCGVDGSGAGAVRLLVLGESEKLGIESAACRLGGVPRVVGGSEGGCGSECGVAGGCVSGAASAVSEAGVAIGGVVGTAAVSEKTLANRAKRHRRRDAKIRKKTAAASGSGNAGGVEAVVGVEAEDVPEWRRRQTTRVGGSVGPKGGFFAEASEETRRRLRGTRAERLAAENELAAFKAKRQLVLEKAKDVAKMVKSQETRLLRDTERNKVQIEKAFLSLAKTGNVPGIGGSVSGGGSAKTVVSGSSSSNLASGTISPNSSVSMKEVHDMQKELETLKLERVQHLELMEKAGVKVPEKSRSMSTGWTTDGNGYFAAHHLAEGYDHLPDAYMVCRDGRIHANYWGEHDFDHYEG